MPQGPLTHIHIRRPAGPTTIEVRVDDLAFFKGDAIVRPANSMLQATTPVMRRLEQAAGREFPTIVRLQQPLPVGAAVVTGAGALPVELLVHGVVSSLEERVTRATVRLALMSALQRAIAFEIKSIGVAPFGLGAGNLDVDDSADVMVGVLTEHMRRAAFPTSVVIVTESELEEHALRTRLRNTE